jgi:hypothetical protein
MAGKKQYRGKKGSGSFLKKRTKKLFDLGCASAERIRSSLPKPQAAAKRRCLTLP